MTPKAEFLEWIDDYCMDQLSAIEKLEFENELKQNVELQEELVLQQEILSAITETDVIKLKEKLKTVAQINNSNEMNPSFDLLDDFADIDELTDSVSSKDLINFYDSLPKVHVYQHELVSNENIHEFYKEQNKTELNGEEDSLNGFDMDDFSEFEGLEEAILEKDILNLRETLNQVAKSVKPQYSSNDIDKYLNDELNGVELEQFKNELSQNRSLKEEVELHKELELAIQEDDIQSLRSQLVQIVETETSWRVSEQSIEDFIDGILEGEELKEFNEELSYNTDLIAEVKFRKEIESAIGEKDIFDLRSQLKAAQENVENTELKSIIPESGSRLYKAIKQFAAIAVVLLGLTSVLSYVFSPAENSYGKYYQAFEGTAERSVSMNANNVLNEFNFAFLNGDHTKAQEILSEAIQNTNDKFVYNYLKGSVFQVDEKYAQAIKEYKKVVQHNDNMYVEEAEWNIGLCLLKQGEKDLAANQLQAVINRNSFYKRDAKALIRKIKYSVK